MHLFVVVWLLLRFIFVFVEQLFDFDMPRYGFLLIYIVSGLYICTMFSLLLTHIHNFSSVFRNLLCVWRPSHHYFFPSILKYHQQYIDCLSVFQELTSAWIKPRFLVSCSGLQISKCFREIFSFWISLYLPVFLTFPEFSSQL